jgi:hypothetical protein
MLLALLAGMIVLASGCKQPAKPKQFSLKISRGNKRLGDAAKKFYKAMEPLKKGKPADATEAQGAYTEIKTALADQKKEFDSIISPVNSPEGAELLDEYRNYLQVQQKILDGSITPMFQIIQDNRYAPSDKWTLIKQHLDRASAEEAGPLRKIKNLHKAYCKAQNFDEVRP